MNSWKNRWIQQEKMNQSAEDDEIVDLSTTEEQMIDQPLVREQVVNKPTAVAQSGDRPIEVEAARTRQAVLPEEQRFAGGTCPQCAMLLQANASFCSHCGASLVAFKSGRPVPQNMAPSPGKGTPAKQPKKGRMSRGKLLWIGLAGIVAVSVVFGILSQTSSMVFGILSQTWGNVVVDITGSSTPQATPATSTPPAVTPAGTPGVTAGALILLNPGVVRQGASMGVTGTGFDPRATVDVLVKQRKSDTGQPISLVNADKYGNFYDNLTVPETLSAGPFFIEARERSSNKVALAAGVVAGGTPQLKLDEQVGRPGDLITLSVHGFSPGETINVYWNTMIGQPFTTLHADSGGGIGQATVQVPFGATGVNTFLFVGAKSLSMVAAPFDLLSLYPTIKLSNYALQADHQLNFSGSGFGPGERVLVYLNNTMDQPMAVIQTTQNGSFANATGFYIPFNLKGRQTLIFLGEESRASVAISWTVLPYMPNAQASTYGALPGTTVSFYATGFARQEVVHVYIGHTQNNAGNMVSCFRTDDRGNAVAAGSYVIPGDAQGKLVFTLIGAKSDGTALATMSITAPPSPVQVPPQPTFTCPLDNEAP